MTYIRHQVTYQGARITYGGNYLNFPVIDAIDASVVNNLDVPAGWLVPTITEWEAERLSWSSNNTPGAFASPLKLTAGGFRPYTFPPPISLIGEYGYYHSRTINAENGYIAYIGDTIAGESGGSPRGQGSSLRLIKQIGLPLISGDQSFTYNGSSWTYREVESEGRIWMDRNLGASQVASAFNDSAAYGDLFQWGRNIDGHQVRTSSHTNTLSNSDTPGHGDFILTSASPYDWRDPQNDNLWQPI